MPEAAPLTATRAMRTCQEGSHDHDGQLGGESRCARAESRFSAHHLGAALCVTGAGQIAIGDNMPSDQRDPGPAIIPATERLDTITTVGYRASHRITLRRNSALSASLMPR